MKRHSMFAATTLAGALAIAMPAHAAGPLGAISGGAGGGVMGTLGGTLSSPTSNLGFGGAGVLGATSQFQGQIVQPPLTIQRPAVPSVNPNLGLGAGGALDAAGQVQGEIARPDLNVPSAPVRRATGAVQSAGDRAQSRIGTASDVVSSTSASGDASARGGASAGSMSVNADGSARARAQASY